MTTRGLAELLQAKRAGNGKWVARCPAHADSSPSLSIGEGRDGCVLLHCFAGCTNGAILAALGLAYKDLFSSRPVLPEEFAVRKAEREAAELAARARRRWLSEPYDNARKSAAIATQLLTLLRRNPRDERIAQLFHHALDDERRWDAEAERREAQIKARHYGDRK